MRKKLTVFILILVLCATSVGALSAFAASGTINNFTYTKDSFTSEDFTKQTNLGIASLPSKLSFEGNDKQSVGVINQVEKSGAYSVEFKMFTSTDGHQDFFFTLGNDSGNSGGAIIFGENVVTIGRTAGDFSLNVPAAESGAKIYDASGEIVATGNYVMTALGGWASGEMLYKFDVLVNGDINVYYDFASTVNPLTTLRNVIKGLPGGWSDGYFTIIPHVNPAESEAGRQRSIDYIVIDGVKDDFQSLDTDKWSIIGDTLKVRVETEFKFLDKYNDIVASNFKFSDDGLNAGDTVFDISFISEARKANQGINWGIMFGLENQSDPKTSLDVTSLNLSAASTSFTLGNGSEAAALVKSSGDGENATPAYLYNSDCRIRIVGKKGGTLDFYRQSVGENIETLHSSYVGVNVNGYIALFNEGTIGAENDYAKYKQVSIEANVSYRVKSVKLNQAVFTNAEVGSVIELQSTVLTYPIANSGVVYSILEGAEVAQLIENGTKLKIVSDGKITVKATSVVDSSVSDSFTFTVKELKFENYRLKEGFSKLNESDWTLMDEDKNISIDEGLYISKDFKSDANGSAKLVSNVQFATNPKLDTVFDITFKSDLLGSQFRNPNFSWGLIFGMKDKNALAGDEGVGYVKIDYISTQSYLGGVKVAPQYKGDRTSENCDVYCESPIGYTVRIVGNKDGTLDVYRQYSVYEKITDKFATYSGFDFNGYVAFTTDSVKATGEGVNNDYSVCFSNVVLSGNVVIDDIYTIDNVVIDKEVFRDAIVSSIPLKCGGVVNSSPNLTVYRGIEYSLVSGSATMTDGMLTITGEGKIKVRAQSKLDNTKFEEYEFTAILLQVTNIIVDLKNFEGITNDSQPIELIATLECNSLANKYQSVIWTVTSGNAEVVANQLRITGIGEVVLKVQSEYVPEKFKEIKFTVTDADDNQTDIGDDGKVHLAGTLSAPVITVIVIGSVVVAAGIVFGIFMLIKKMKKNDRKN